MVGVATDLLASTVLTASLYMLRHHLISRSIGRSFDRSYEVARGALVTTLTTPEAAFAPHMAEAGPRTTSICFTSGVEADIRSHSTNL